MYGPRHTRPNAHFTQCAANARLNAHPAAISICRTAARAREVTLASGTPRARCAFGMTGVDYVPLLASGGLSLIFASEMVVRVGTVANNVGPKFLPTDLRRAIPWVPHAALHSHERATGCAPLLIRVPVKRKPDSSAAATATQRQRAATFGSRKTKGSARAYVLTLVIFWSGWRDSNSRPLAPHASALPGCATPRRS